jgi:hypothetical protein
MLTCVGILFSVARRANQTSLSSPEVFAEETQRRRRNPFAAPAA